MKKKRQKLIAQWPASFIEADRTMFEKHRTPPELVVDAGVIRATDREARRLGLVGKGDMAGQVYPYVSPWTGNVVNIRIRRDNPETDEEGRPKNKYMTPPKDVAKRILYYPPGAKEKLENRSVLIVLVESEKAALALTAWAQRMGFGDRVLFIAMGGCWGWSQDKQPLADFAHFEGLTIYLLLDANVATKANVQEAEQALVAALCALQCETHILRLPQMEGVNGPDDLLAEPDGDELMNTVFGNRKPAVVAPFSDDAIATRFADEQKDNLRFVKQWGLWLVWDGQRWCEDTTQQVGRLVQDFCHKAAGQCGKLAEAKHIRSSRTIEAVHREASKKTQLAATVEQWDADTFPLGTPSGTMKLNTGELRPVERNDYITKLTAVAPENKEPKLWLRFLGEITKGDKELQGYLQRVCGYCLTGDTREHAFFFLHGLGANGKSVFVKTIADILGEYARVAAMESFTASHNPQHPTDLAGLRGARLVTATETEDGHRWAESKLKNITGGEKITARKMRQDFFDYKPQFKLLLSGNHRPQLRNVDEAMRRRIHLVPFTVTIPADKRDPKLAEKLKPEWGAILKWAIEGCLAWQREGLRPPEAVTAATEDYLSSQDVLGQWLSEDTEEAKSYKEKSGDLYRAFKGWAEARGEYVWPQKQFSQKLTERGYRLTKSNGERYVLGMRKRLQQRAAGTVTPINSKAGSSKKFAKK